MENTRLIPFITEDQLLQRAQALGKQISADHPGEEILVVGVLKGAVIFLADLLRSISVPCALEFISVSSYSGTKSTGQVRLNLDLSRDISGKSVVLVEDIIDTGHTMDYLLELLNVRKPKSLKICTLLSKPSKHHMRNKLDYVGFEIQDEFVVGYGLDYNGIYRGLPYLAKLEFIAR